MSIPSCHISIHHRAPWIPRLLALKAWLQGLWGEFVAPAKQQVEVPKSWMRRVTVPNAQQTTGWIEVVGYKWTGMWTRKWSPNAYSSRFGSSPCSLSHAHLRAAVHSTRAPAGAPALVTFSIWYSCLAHLNAHLFVQLLLISSYVHWVAQFC